MTIHRSSLVLGALALLPACEAEPWRPSGVGAPVVDESAFEPALADPAARSLVDDVIWDPTPGPGPRPVADGAAPRVLWLWYADGGPPPFTGFCKTATPPAFTCEWGASEEQCKRRVQYFLDRWYADFNLVFTLTRPTSGAFYTEIITFSGGQWCPGIPMDAGGIAVAKCQTDSNGGVCYTFHCTNARECAQTISQEHAHLVGLDHTESRNDAMYPYAMCTTCNGFENKDNKTVGSSCGVLTQNSYATMKMRLGPWPGGEKPMVLPACDDGESPVAIILQPGNGTTQPADFHVFAKATDDCDIDEATVTVEGPSLGTTLTSTRTNGGPYDWPLTGLSGCVTITVTAKDTAGKTHASSVTVSAPGSAGSCLGMGGGGGGGQGGADGTGGTAGAGGGEDGGGGGCSFAKRLPGLTPMMLVTAVLAARLRRKARRPRPIW